MTNGMDHRRNARRRPDRECAIAGGCRMATCKTRLFEATKFASACRPVSKSRLTFPIGIGASKVQRLRFLPVRDAGLSPHATPMIASDGV